MGIMLNRYGLIGIDSDSAWIFYSPKTKRLAVLPSYDGEIPTRENLSELFEPTYRQNCKRIRQIGFINTTDCLLRCIYCFNSAGTTHNYLEPEIAANVIREFLSDEIPFDELIVKFFGGEPTMNMALIRHVVNSLQHIRDKVNYHIVTAGYIRPNELEWMIENNFVFTVSIDGNQAIQQQQRPLSVSSTNTFTPEETLRRLTSAGASCKVRMTVTDANVDFLPESMAYFHSLGAKIVHIEPVTFSGRASTGVNRPDPKKFCQELLNAVDEGSRLGMQVINSSYMNLIKEDEHYCSAGDNHIVVGTDGEISHCYEVADQCSPHSLDMIKGKYNKRTKKIEYFSKKYKCPENVTSVPLSCMKCFAISVCGGGCPSRNLADVNKPYNQGGYFCTITRMILPAILIRIAKAAGLLPLNKEKNWRFT